MAGIIEIIVQTPLFWMSLLHIPLLALLPDIFFKAAKMTIQPSDTDLARFNDRDHTDPLVNKTWKKLKESKALLGNLKSRKKSDVSSTDVEMKSKQTRTASGRSGYAFSQEEGGSTSQKKMVKLYEEQPKPHARARSVFSGGSSSRDDPGM